MRFVFPVLLLPSPLARPLLPSSFFEDVDDEAESVEVVGLVCRGSVCELSDNVIFSSSSSDSDLFSK